MNYLPYCASQMCHEENKGKKGVCFPDLSTRDEKH